MEAKGGITAAPRTGGFGGGGGGGLDRWYHVPKREKPRVESYEGMCVCVCVRCGWAGLA